MHLAPGPAVQFCPLPWPPGPFAPTSCSVMGESARLPPDAEETEGHAVRSTALAHSLGQRLGTSKPHEEHAGFGEDQDNSSFGPLLEFTVQSAEHTGFRDGKGGSQAQWWIPKSTAPSRGSGPLPL